MGSKKIHNFLGEQKEQNIDIDGEQKEQKEEASQPESDPTVRSVLDTFDGELV